MASTAPNDRDSTKDIGDMPPVMTARKTGWRSIQIRQHDQQLDSKQGKKEPVSPKAEENKEQPEQERENDPSPREENDDQEDVANSNKGKNNELSMVLSALRGTVAAAAAAKDDNENKTHVEMLQEPESPRPSRNARADQIIAAAEAARDKAEYNMHNQPAEIYIPEPSESVDMDSEPTTPVPAQFSPQEETTNDKHPDHHHHPQQVHIDLPADKNMADYITPPTPGTPPATNPMYSEELQDQPLEEEPSSSPSSSSPTNEETKKGFQPNTLNPREQEQAGIEIRMKVYIGQ